MIVGVGKVRDVLLANYSLSVVGSTDKRISYKVKPVRRG